MRNDGKSVKQSPLLQRGSVKYAPVKQNRSTNPFDTSNNPFDDDVEDSNNHPVKSSNPFDDEEEEIELSPQSFRPPTIKEQHRRSLNPFDEDTPSNTYTPISRSQVKEREHQPPQSITSDRPPSPPSSRQSSMTRVPPVTSNSSRNYPPKPPQDRGKFLKKLNKIDEKLQKDKHEEIDEVCLDASQENAIIRMLVAKRVYGYPGTTGSILSNYIQYVKNNHPLLSICLLNSLNPFGRKERILVFTNSLFFAIFVTFLITETTFVPKISTCRLPCNQFTPVNSTVVTCNGGYNDGLSYDEYKSACSYYSDWMLTALCGICIVAYQSLLEFLATCGCIQGKKSFQNNCCGSRIKGCVEWFGGCMLTFCTIVSVTFLLWAIIACYVLDVGFEIIGTILISKLWSTGEWFAWSAPYFAYRYPLDRKHFYRRLLRHEGKDKPLQQVVGRDSSTLV